jgi:hypothetical protein
METEKDNFLVTLLKARNHFHLILPSSGETLFQTDRNTNNNNHSSNSIEDHHDALQLVHRPKEETDNNDDKQWYSCCERLENFVALQTLPFVDLMKDAQVQANPRAEMKYTRQFRKDQAMTKRQRAQLLKKTGVSNLINHFEKMSSSK